MKSKRRQEETYKQTQSKKERREFVRSLLFDGLWFFIDLWFVWPLSHIWAVALAALVIAIHFATSSWHSRTRLISCVLLLACTAMIIHFIPPNESEIHGFLTPGGDPLPSGPCPATQYETREASVYFGGNEARISIGRTIIALSLSRRPVLEFQLTDKGLQITGEIYTKSGEVAWLLDNEFWLNPNLQFRSDHPDPHTLIVRDNMGTEILSIRYLNNRAIQFTGHLFFPEGDKYIVIDKNGIQVPSSGSPSHIFGFCVDTTDSPSGPFSLISVIGNNVSVGHIGFP